MRPAAAARGYAPLYVAGTRCPGCHGRAWNVGRHAAECPRCATAVPLAHPNIERIA